MNDTLDMMAKVMGPIFRKLVGVVAVVVLLIVLGIPVLAVIVMDLLTYGDPPGLFKNDTWQAIRSLWAGK